METSVFKQEEQSQSVLILCSMASNLEILFLSLCVCVFRFFGSFEGDGFPWTFKMGHMKCLYDTRNLEFIQHLSG